MAWDQNSTNAYTNMPFGGTPEQLLARGYTWDETSGWSQPGGSTQTGNQDYSGNSGNTGVGNYGQDARVANNWNSTNAPWNYRGIGGMVGNQGGFAGGVGNQNRGFGYGATTNPTANNWNSTNAPWNQRGGSGNTGYDENGRPTAGQYSGGTYNPNTAPRQNNTGATIYPGATTTATPYQLASSDDPFSNILTDMAAEDPSKVYIDQTSQSYTRNILNQYQQDTGQALQYLKNAGAAGVAGYGGLNDFYTQSAGQNNALAQLQANRAESTYGGAYNQATGAANAALGYGMQAGQGQLADTGKMMGYYQRMAAQNQLPGQSLIEQNLGQNTAEAVARMKEMGGNSMALLGATGNAYNQQAAGLRDVGIQAANYQVGNQQAQAAAAQQAIGLRAGAYGQMANAQAGYGNAMQNAAAQYGGAQERYAANQQNAYNQGVGWQAAGREGLTQAQMSEQGNLSNFMGSQATGTSNLLQSLMQQRLQAEQQQADLQRRSLLDVSAAASSAYEVQQEAEEKSWERNQYNQWANNFQYWNQFANQNTQPGVSNATGNAINLWGTGANIDAQNRQLDQSNTAMWLDYMSKTQAGYQQPNSPYDYNPYSR